MTTQNTQNMKEYQPEELSLWDRLFNRYKKLPFEHRQERWECSVGEVFFRDCVIYHVVDRLTGGYTIEKSYLDVLDY